MALAPGAYRAPERAPARDGQDAAVATVAFDPAHRAGTPAIDARAPTATDAKADNARAGRAATGWRPRAKPPRARPLKFEMDTTRREVASERTHALGARFAARVAWCCQEGCYPHKDHHVNQDACATWEAREMAHEEAVIDAEGNDAVERRETGRVLVGVFDGHGKHGEECAQIARATFAETLARETRGGAALRDGYARTFEAVNAVVCKEMGENASFSGSTAITALFDDEGVVRVGNVGDSRCVVGVERAAGVAVGNRHTRRWEVRDLTHDQTCFRADERARMKAEATSPMTFATIGMVLGETEAHEDFGDGEPGSDEEYCDDPPRVFMAGYRFPGCAFTRSIGDTVGKSLGVSATPEMSEFDLNAEPSTRCVVVASDGVFEFMSSAETMAIAEKFYEENMPGAAERAAHAIVRAAFSRWQEHDERADDITAVVTFIYPLDSDTSTATVVVNDMDDALNKLLL